MTGPSASNLGGVAGVPIVKGMNKSRVLLTSSKITKRAWSTFIINVPICILMITRFLITDVGRYTVDLTRSAASGPYKVITLQKSKHCKGTVHLDQCQGCYRSHSNKEVVAK